MNSPKQLLLLSLVLSGCTHFERTRLSEPKGEVRVPDQASRVKEDRPANSDRVWTELGYARRRLPYVVLEKSVVTPAIVHAGEAIRYRLTYAACLPKSKHALTGIMRTRVLLKEREVQDRIEQNYLLKAGRWVVETMINVLGSAGSGQYRIELEFRRR